MNFLQKDIMQIQFDINLQKTSSVVRKQNINIIFSFITTAYKTFWFAQTANVCSENVLRYLLEYEC